MAQVREAQQVPLAFVVNGRPVELIVEPHLMLLDLLRDRLGLKGAKRSCDLQVCGACIVLVNGKAISSCTYLAFEARNASVLTIEGLASPEGLHPLLHAFMENAALQCGYCTPGMILAAKALLDENPQPTADEIAEYMKGNICRCTGYKKIVEAVLDASQRLASPTAALGEKASA
jgi:carbon-monoxide dehydrogenase small subunit